VSGHRTIVVDAMSGNSRRWSTWERYIYCTGCRWRGPRRDVADHLTALLLDVDRDWHGDVVA
jgi:hypothetical protein